MWESNWQRINVQNIQGAHAAQHKKDKQANQNMGRRPKQTFLQKRISSVQLLSHVWLFGTPWTAACQASLFITNSRSLLKLMSIESVLPSNHLISLVIPFSHLQSFPASGSFPMSQYFASGGQSIGVSASASVLPINIQDWSPLRWTDRISLQSKGLSRVFSKSINSSALIFLYSPTFTSIHDHWKNHSFD